MIRRRRRRRTSLPSSSSGVIMTTVVGPRLWCRHHLTSHSVLQYFSIFLNMETARTFQKSETGWKIKRLRLPKHADFAKRLSFVTLETGGRARMLSVSPSDIHYLPGLECHQALHQTLPADRLTVERIIGSKATLQVFSQKSEHHQTSLLTGTGTASTTVSRILFSFQYFISTKKM